ncbi:MAG: transglutaminase-like domain-containing protein [Oscillospiraceae bacterium]|nr:transglutaminase-like domain-containing protein [Oscillospiraceae bacterium]
MSRPQKHEPIPISGEKSTHGEIAGFWGRMLESEVLAAYFACLFLGTGLSVALLALTELDRAFFRSLGYAAIAAAVPAAAAYRRWIPLCAAGFAGLCTLAAGLYFGTLGRWADYLAGFAIWVRGGALYHEIYSEGAALGFLQFLIIFAVTMVIYPLSARPALYPALIIISAGVLIFSYTLAPGDMTPALCGACAGVIILLPGIYARHAQKSGGRHSRARMQMIAIPAAVLAVLLAFLITPEDARSWRSRTLVNLADDIATFFRGPYSYWPSVPSNFTLYDVGFRGDRGRLGGPVYLSGRQALSVESPMPVLLKGRVYDVYTGSDWEIGAPDGDLRFESILWRSSRREALGQDRPLGGRHTGGLYNNLTREINIALEYSSSIYTTLFTAGRIRDLRFSPRLIDPEAFYNMRSEVYMHQRMPTRQGFELRTRVWNTALADFDARFLELEAAASALEDKRFEDLSARYTALPENLPQSVRELAADITAGKGTPYGKARAIVKWLAETGEYSLEPEIVPADEDFVAHFLRTKIGYCTYYATALAVMARCEGIPSRYVIGFALEETGQNMYTATGETAHAWAELYFSGIGWVEMDPLSWDASAPLNRGEAEEREAAQSPVQAPVYEPPQEAAPESPRLDFVASEPEYKAVYWPYLVIPAGIAAIILLPRYAVRKLLGRKSRQFSLSKVCGREDNYFRRLDIYYTDIIKQFALLGLAPLPGETLVTFPQRVDRRIRFDAAGFAPIAKAVSDYRFAEAAPSQSQVEYAHEYHALLEGLLLERFGKWMYLVKRAVR